MKKPSDSDAERPSPPPETTSFDPKTWGRAAAPPPPPAIPPAKDAAAPAAKSRRGLLLPIGLAVVAVVAAATVVFVLQGHHRAGPTDTAGAPPTAAIQGQRRTLVVSGPTEIQGALTSAGVPAAEAADVAKMATGRIAGTGDLTLIMMIDPKVGGAHLVSLDARRDDGSGVVIQADASGAYHAKVTAADLKTVVKAVRGEMDAYSFYSSAVSQHLTDSLISPFAQALAFDFDFQREIHAGDVFEAVFEDRQNSRGESVGVGRLLYVSMETKDKSRALYWFQPATGDPGWFDGNGRSTVRSLMRTPVEGARISSTFGMRVHPVLGFMKMHKGIDFAAPVGTPIYAAGDGAVTFAAMAGTAGNRVILHHDNGWETWYLHMSAFGPGVVVGARVHQGQQIGAIGTTGRSTGPHLHYEVHVDNEPVDPASLQMASGRSLDGTALKAFLKERDRIDALRAAQNG